MISALFFSESDENRQNCLKYNNISDDLWKEFPESGAYIKNIMIFCGYNNRESIIRLKDENEVSKMFSTVIELQELVPEHQKDEMFGIFRKNPSLLKILPGIEQGFQRFLKKVENLVPNVPINAKMSKKRPNKLISHELSTTDKKRPTVNDLKERLRVWFEKELPTRANNTSVEEAMGLFTIKENANKSFEFKCLKCNTPCIIPNGETSKISISNATRHITRNCWLNDKKKRKLDTDSNQSTVSSYFIQRRVFVPRSPEDCDFNFANSTTKQTSTPKSATKVASNSTISDSNYLKRTFENASTNENIAKENLVTAFDADKGKGTCKNLEINNIEETSSATVMEDLNNSNETPSPSTDTANDIKNSCITPNEHQGLNINNNPGTSIKSSTSTSPCISADKKTGKPIKKSNITTRKSTNSNKNNSSKNLTPPGGAEKKGYSGR